jgi:hypothetical protein
MLQTTSKAAAIILQLTLMLVKKNGVGNQVTAMCHVAVVCCNTGLAE